MCLSFPSDHSLYQKAVFFAAPYLFCSSVYLNSASWYCFHDIWNHSAHPIRVKQLKLSVLQLLTTQYYTWYWWVSGLSPLPCTHKVTQNFSNRICSCIQLTGIHSVDWTVHTRTSVSDPDQQVPPNDFIWEQQTVPVHKTPFYVRIPISLGHLICFSGNKSDNIS